MKAILKNEVIAESNDTIVINEEHYFPAESVNIEFLKRNGRTGTCAERGGFCNYNVEVNGAVEKDAAMSFVEPVEAAEQIRNYIVFNSEIVKVEE